MKFIFQRPKCLFFGPEFLEKEDSEDKVENLDDLLSLYNLGGLNSIKNSKESDSLSYQNFLKQIIREKSNDKDVLKGGIK